MKLEWFRHHKNFVYWVLLPVVGGGMIFFGLSDALRRHSGTARGKSASYTLNGRLQFLSPQEITARRLALTHFRPPHMRSSRGPDGKSYVHDVSTYEAVRQEMQLKTAAANGFEVGDKEHEDAILQNVKGQIQARSGEQHKATPENYQKLLSEVQLSRTQFERLVHQDLLVNRNLQFISDIPPVISGKLFLEYMKDKEIVRLRYTALKTEDFMKDTKEPEEGKVKEFYDKYARQMDIPQQTVQKMTMEQQMEWYTAQQYTKVFKTEPKMSAELMYFNPEKLIAEIKPTTEELKAHYEKNKAITSDWHEKADPANPTGGPKIKDFEVVKEDVEKHWRKQTIPQRIEERVNKFNEELATARKNYDLAQKVIPEALRRPFDFAEWARDQGMPFWVTDMKTRHEYAKGKKELFAKDAAWLENYVPYNEEATRFPQMHLERTEFEMGNREKGYILWRRKDYTPGRTRDYADAKPLIAEHLKIEQTAKLAHEAAEKLRVQWAKGENLPAIETLDEIIGSAEQVSKDTTKKFNELLKEYLNGEEGARLAVGEILPIAEGDVTEKEGEESNQHKRLYVGFAVERTPPTWEQFEKDTIWSSEKGKTATENVKKAESQFVFAALTRQLNSGITMSNEDELNLGDVYHDKE
jgi:hypothetical protein